MEYQNQYSSLGPGFEMNNPKPKKGIPIPIFIFLIVSVLLAGVSMGLFPQSFSDYKIYSEAEERTYQGETSQALEDLFSIQEAHPDSLPVTIRLLDLSMKNGYYDLAAYVFNEYLVGKELSDSQYARMMEYSRKLDSYYLTCDAIDSLFAVIEADNDDSAEALERHTEWLREEIGKLHQDREQYAAVLYYYDAMLCPDRDTQYEYLLEAYREDPELYDVRVLLGNAERSRGNMAEAYGYLNTAVRKEARDAGALRGLAVMAMLDGRPEEGLEKARQAYESDPDSLYVRETYLIALHVNGQNEKREQEIIAEIEAIQGSLEEDTQQFLDGQLTLEDYYITG